MSSRSVWQLCPADPIAASRLSHACGLPILIGQFLLNRGIRNRPGAERFFSPTMEALGDPLELPDMPKAVARIRRAVASRRPIMVFGDSDVDGITSSAIVSELLTSLGATPMVRISNRVLHGYGFPGVLVQEAVRLKVGLVILLDCGTNQAEEIRTLATSRIETIVLDHHVPTDRIAHPHALVNPHTNWHRPPEATVDVSFPGKRSASLHRNDLAIGEGVNPHQGAGAGKGLCSAGLAFKLAHAMWGAADERLVSLLDLAAIGTLADCAPLLGENRTLVVLGLRQLLHTRRPGLRLLCEAVGLSKPTPDQVLQRLTPCLNAAGRLGDATRVWRLLVEPSQRRAKLLIRDIQDAHATGKTLYRQILAEANEQASRLHFKDHAVVVIGRRGWHPGFMGPIAAQLADRFGRPAIAVAMDGKTAVGSGRSFGMFNLFEALRACEGVLLRYGGHAHACGLTLDPTHLERFREQLNRYTHTAGVEAPTGRTLKIDADVKLQAVTPDVASEVERFAPFGPENERPLVMARQVRLEEDALRTPWVTDGTATRKIWGKRFDLHPDECYDLVGSPRAVKGDVAVSLCEVRLSVTALCERVRA